MALKSFAITIDTITPNSNIVANVKQLDNVTLNISVTENGLPKDLTNQTLQLYAKRSDGAILQQTTNIKVTDAVNGKVSININNSIFAITGITIAELDISGTDGDIATATFSINVYEKISNSKSLESSTDISLFKQVTTLISQATKEIEEYKSFYTAFTSAGVSVQGLADIKTYIDANLANLKAENSTATNLDSELKTTITSANSIQTTLEQTISSVNNNTDGYLTETTLTPILDSFTPFLQWNGISSKDANILTKGGFYSINAMTVVLETAHYPINGEWGLLFVSETEGGTDGGTVIQIFYGLTSTRLFYRMFNDSNWRDWAEIVTSELLKTNLDSLKTTLEAEINNNNTSTIPDTIEMSTTGITLTDDSAWRSFTTERTVDKHLGDVSLGVDSQFDMPVASLQYNLDNVLQSTIEMLFTSEIKFKDNKDCGTIALVFTNNNGDSTGKGYVGVYDNSNFTVKANSPDLVLDNGYGSTVNVGAGGYFYPTADTQWALGKSGHRWSNLYTQNITNTSDKRVKDNIKYLNASPANAKDTEITTTDLYNFVKNNLKLATYNYTDYNKEEELNNKNKIGFIAQDFLNNPVGESIVHTTDSHGILTYDLNNYINLIAGALQKTIADIENLQTAQQYSNNVAVQNTIIAQQVSNLIVKNATLSKRVTELENKLNPIQK